MTESQRVAELERAAHGDADALQRLVMEYHVPLLRVADRALGAARQRVEAEDIVQEAYVAAFASFGETSFDAPARFFRWLEQIVRNEARQAARHARCGKRDWRREVPARARVGSAADSRSGLLARLCASGTTPSGALARDEAVAALLTCLARLPAEQRLVIRLRFFEEQPVAQVARECGKTEAAVYQQCHRALRALSERLRAVWRREPQR